MRVRFQALARRGALVLTVWLLATPAAQGQTPSKDLPAGPLSLEQVLELAEARSESISIARAGITRADAERARARSGRFPQVSATASYDRALASEFDDVFGTTAGPACAPFTLDQSAALDLRVAEIERAIDCGAVGSGFFGGGDSSIDGGLEDLPFGRANTWRAGVTVSQNIYTGGRLTAQESIAAAGRASADLNVATTKGQLLFDAAQAYYEAALSTRLVAIAEATLEQASGTLRQVQAGLDAGTQPEFEVLRARVNRDNQTPVIIRQRVNRAVAMLRLKQLLDLPASYDLQIADALQDDLLPPPSAFAARIAAIENVMKSGPLDAVVVQGLEAPVPRRVAVDAAEADVRRTTAALSLAEAEKRPSVSLNSSYGRVSYPTGWFSGLDNWRTNWTVGASVQVPIFTGGRQRGDEQAARADVEESRIRLQQVQELADLETRVAWAELLAALAAWQASAGTVEQAARAYEIADVRYRAGVSTQLELTDSRLLLQQAEANRAMASRDVQVARARVALLPEMPLTGTIGIPAQAVPSQPVQPTTPQPPLQVGAGRFLATSAPGTQTQAGR
jgi:outer membrane protein TolC